MSSQTDNIQIQWPDKHRPTLNARHAFQCAASFGDPPGCSLNRIYLGDNLRVMSRLLADYRNRIQLIYLDPPFDSDAQYKMTISPHGEMSHLKTDSIQFSDNWSEHTYLQFIYERLIACRELLAPDGTLYVHCDPKRNYLIRCILNEVFSDSCFINEIVWHYEKWTVSRTAGFQCNHDTLLVYAKSPKPKFRVLKQITQNLESKYQKGYLIGGGYGPTGLVVYDPDNLTVKDLIATGKYQVHYAKTDGKPLSDVWDIPIINPMAHERTGYPTQKPEKLLKQIIESSTDEGDIILDGFMGCGTAVSVARQMNRAWIGIDSNLHAVHLALKRLTAPLHHQSSRNQNGFSLYTSQSASPCSNILRTVSAYIQNGKLTLDCRIPQSVLDTFPHNPDLYNWKCYIDAVYIDWNYDGSVFRPSTFDIPSKRDTILGAYALPDHITGIGVCLVDILDNYYLGSFSTDINSK